MSAMTKRNTRVFIDTNIFLGLYNSNDAGNVEAFTKALFQNRSSLVTTEQAINEYLRNRARIIQIFRKEFANSLKEQTSSFVRSLPEYQEYAAGLSSLQSHQETVLDKLDLILENPDHDHIYDRFMRLWKPNNTIATTEAHVQAGLRRKALGDPPGGDKETCGDEVIWEALISEPDRNLIIVTKDETYVKYQEYLIYEYRKRTGHELAIRDKVHAAFTLLGIKVEQRARDAEDGIRWLDIIIQAFRQLGGRGTLAEIEEECRDIVSLFYPGKDAKNNTVDSTIRRTIYQHSSDVDAYLGKRDLFHRVSSGLWELREKS